MSGEHGKRLAFLLEKAQGGDQSALQELCRDLEACVRGYFSQKFQDASLVDDLCQETYVRLLRNLPNVREPLKLRGFVTKVAIHVSQDYFRGKYRRAEHIQPASSDTETEDQAFESAGHYESQDAIIDNVDLEKALQELPEKARRILEMKVDGYRYEEIAEELGVTVSAIKMQVKRSLEHLRSVLVDVTFLMIGATYLVKALVGGA